MIPQIVEMKKPLLESGQEDDGDTITRQEFIGNIKEYFRQAAQMRLEEIEEGPTC